MLRHLIVMLSLVLTATDALADVRVTRRMQMTSGDPAFRRLPKEATSQDHRVILKGPRMMRHVSPSVAQLIDLQEERLYTIDFQRKTYSVRTFAEMRAENERVKEQMAKYRVQAEAQMLKLRDEQARWQAQAEEQAARRGRRSRETPAPMPVQKTDEERVREFVRNYEHTSAPTGQRREMLGLDAQEVVSTTRMGPTEDNPSGMLITVTQWLADVPELQELDAFDRRYHDAIGQAMPSPTALTPDLSAMSAAVQSNPMYADVMNRIKVDDSVTGTPVLIVMKTGPAVEGEATASNGAGGALGTLGRQAGRAFGVPGFGKREVTPAARPVPVTTTQHEIVELSRTVTDAEVAIPDGFKEVKPPRGR
jgi:hypothetical protein